MKKAMIPLFAIILALISIAVLSSCGGIVEFNVNFIVDGEVYATVGTSGEEAVKIPQNPTKEGYPFEGWYWDFGTWKKPFTANSLLDAPLSSDMNVYAKWGCVHISSDWITDKEATCKEEGVKHKECTECNVVLETATVDKLKVHTPITDSRVEPTLNSTGLTEGAHCKICGEVLVVQATIPMLTSKSTLTTDTLSLEGSNISGSVSYSTARFNLIDDITVTNNSPWTVSTDTYGVQTIATKIAPLNEGNNTFYIHVINPDQTVSTYTLNIYRNHLYTVSFNANGGTDVPAQYIEEGCLANEPPTTTRVGYTFASWDYNFATPITSNITISANWSANGNTPYKVEYYLENVDKTGYEPITSEEENLTGITDTAAYAEQKSFEHFTLKSDISTLYGNISGNGSLVLKVYYTRNEYTLSNSNTNCGIITNAGSYVYGSAVKSVAVQKPGYEFVGWYSGEELLSTESEYTFIVEKNVVARFDVLEEMKNFDFTSTDVTCTITGIKDKSVTEIVVPDYVTSISFSAFIACSSLESITIPFVGTTVDGRELTYFGYIFGDNPRENERYIPSSLKTVIITGGTSIGYRAFEYCTSLESITIGNGITRIGDGAFYGCDSLTSVTIPDSVTSIGFEVFENCTSLTSIKYRGTEEQWNAITKGTNWDSNTGSYAIIYNYTGE